MCGYNIAWKNIRIFAIIAKILSLAMKKNIQASLILFRSLIRIFSDYATEDKLHSLRKILK